MSFRIIRDFVETPVLEFNCDRSCGFNCTGAVKKGTEYDQTTHAAFIQQAVAQGWKITLHEHVCPEHVKKDRAELSRIILPEFHTNMRSN